MIRPNVSASAIPSEGTLERTDAGYGSNADVALDRGDPRDPLRGATPSRCERRLCYCDRSDRFQAELDEDGQTTTVELRLISRIVREEDVRIVASKTFSATATTSSSETESVIEAFDIAAGRLFPDYSNWVVSTLKAQ